MTDDATPGESRDEDADRGEDADGGTEARHDRITVHRTPPGGSSLSFWTSARHPVRVAINYAVIWLVRISPSLAAKRWLLRRIGVTVGDRVAWGLEATPDVFWPDYVTVEDRAVVGYDSTLLCHEFLQDEYRIGEVVVGEEAMIGAGAVVLPGVRIGAGASVAANSLVTEDVPPGETVAGVPATPMTSDAIDGAVRTGRAGTPDASGPTDPAGSGSGTGSDDADQGRA